MSGERFLGSRVRHRRQVLDMTGQQLAEAMRVSSSSVSHWESGRTVPARERQARLSAVLGVHASYFYGHDATDCVLVGAFLRGASVAVLVASSGYSRERIEAAIRTLSMWRIPPRGPESHKSTEGGTTDEA